MTGAMGHLPVRAASIVVVLTALTCGTAGTLLPATTSPSSESVEGVALIKTDGMLREACGRAANTLHFTVPCPGLIPLPKTAVGCRTTDISEYAGGKDCTENSGAGVEPKGVLD